MTGGCREALIWVGLPATEGEETAAAGNLLAFGGGLKMARRSEMPSVTCEGPSWGDLTVCPSGSTVPHDEVKVSRGTIAAAWGCLTVTRGAETVGDGRLGATRGCLAEDEALGRARDSHFVR